MVIQVSFSESAQDRHESWALDIAVNFGLSSARSYLEEIESARKKIAAFPEIGTDFLSTVRMNLKRLVTPSGYSVFYQLDSLLIPKHALIISIIRGQENQP